MIQTPKFCQRCGRELISRYKHGPRWYDEHTREIRGGERINYLMCPKLNYFTTSHSLYKELLRGEWVSEPGWYWTG